MRCAGDASDGYCGNVSGSQRDVQGSLNRGRGLAYENHYQRLRDCYACMYPSGYPLIWKLRDSHFTWMAFFDANSAPSP